jgi:hypothetical protein
MRLMIFALGSVLSFGTGRYVALDRLSSKNRGLKAFPPRAVEGAFEVRAVQNGSLASWRRSEVLPFLGPPYPLLETHLGL